MTVPLQPSMTNAPSPAPSRADPINFSARADAYHDWLVPWVNSEFPALIEWLRLRANDVLGWANAAQSDRALCQAAAAAVALQSPAANAAAAAASAAQAAVYASQAQATNPDSPMRLNPQRITSSFTVPTGYNAESAGPITVADGVTVAVADGATWVVH